MKYLSNIKLSLIVALYLLFSVNKLLHSQNWQWAKSAGGSEGDVISDMCIDLNNDVIIVGEYESPVFTSATSSVNSPGIGSITIFVLKQNSNGNVLWLKSIGSFSEKASFTSIDTDLSGNIYVAGVFVSPSFTFNSSNVLVHSNTGTYCSFIAKFDINGNIVWAKNIGGTAFVGRPTSISTNNFGEIVVAGNYSSPSANFGTFVLNNSNPPFADIFVAKFDSNGNDIWAKSFGGKREEYAEDIARDNIGNIFITGAFESDTAYFESTIFTNTSSGLCTSLMACFTDFFIVKIDNNGNLIWGNKAGTLDHDWGRSLDIDLNGNIYVTGDYQSSYPITFGNSTINNTNNRYHDIFIVKYDTNGNILFAKGAGSAGNEYAEDISVDSCGNIFIVGVSLFIQNNETFFLNSNISFIMNNLSSPWWTFQGCYILKYDTNGNPVNGISLDYGFGWVYYGKHGPSIEVESNGELYIASEFDHNFNISSYSLNNINNSVDAFIAKLDNKAFALTVVQSPSILCNNQCTGTATVNPINNNCSYGPYFYQWSTNPVQTTQTAINLCPGTYTVVVTDALNNTSTQFVVIDQLPGLSISVDSTATICGKKDGIAAVFPSGGTPGYTYNWMPSNQTTATAINLSSGIYSVTVTDINGCSQTKPVSVPSIPITINLTSSPTNCTSDVGIATVSYANGTSPYSFLWNNQETTQTINGLAPGVYSVTVIDANGCSQSQTVKCEMETELSVPNAFSPNDDGVNDVFVLQGWENCVSELEFIIYNRWGEKIFESADPLKGWDGKEAAEYNDASVFTYYIEATLYNGSRVSKKGNISLIR